MGTSSRLCSFGGMLFLNNRFLVSCTHSNRVSTTKSSSSTFNTLPREQTKNNLLVSSVYVSKHSFTHFIMPHRGRRMRRSRKKRGGTFNKRVRAVFNSQVETKTKSAFDSNTAITDVINIRQLFIVDDGTQEDERIGNRIRLTGIHARLRFVCNAVAGQLRLVRIIIYRQKGSQVGVSPIPGGIGDVVDKDNFTVKKDVLLMLPGGGGDRSTQTFDYHKRFGAGSGGSLVEYFGPAGANVSTGNWFIAYLSNATVPSNDIPLAYQYETFYKDA